MEPVHLYVALLDVLAYKEHLVNDRREGSFTFRDDLSAALTVFDTVNESVFGVQAISDTIVLTCSSHDQFTEFLGLLREVFVAFMRQGLLVRGGVAYGKHFQSNRLTYSHAIARAYDLESSRAVYPRIVVDENIIQMYEGGTGLTPIRGAGLLCNENGVFFIDVLTPDNWPDVYAQAVKIYQTSSNLPQFSEEAFSKHIRFQRYLLSSPSAPHDATPYIAEIEIC